MQYWHRTYMGCWIRTETPDIKLFIYNLLVFDTCTGREPSFQPVGLEPVVGHRHKNVIGCLPLSPHEKFSSASGQNIRAESTNIVEYNIGVHFHDLG